VRWLIAFMLTILLILCATFLHSSLTQYRLAVTKEQTDWPSVNGTITAVKTVIAEGVKINVFFDYQIDGMDLSASQVVDYENYFRGDSVQVYYQPSNPVKAFILPTVDSEWWRLAAFVLPFLIVLLGSTAIWSFSMRRLQGWGVGLTIIATLLIGIYVVSVLSGIPFTVMLFGAILGSILTVEKLEPILDRRARGNHPVRMERDTGGQVQN